MTGKHKHSCSLDVLDIQPDTPAEAWMAIWGVDDDVLRDTETQDLWALLAPSGKR